MIEWILAVLSSIFLIFNFIFLRKNYQSFAKYNLNFLELSEEIGLSVVICINGEATKFPIYFPKIIEQEYSEFEIIIVYKNISDAIHSFIVKQASHFHNVRLFTLPDDAPFTEKKQALNYGIEQSHFPIIVTIDDDCYPENEYWLKSINQHFQNLNSDILLGLSPYISQKSLINQWIRYDAFQVAVNYGSATIEGNAYMGIGRNMAFKKPLWSNDYLEQYKDFGSGDDTSLVQFYKGQKKISLMLQPLAYSFPHHCFSDWFFQKLRHISKGKLMANSSLVGLIRLPITAVLFWFFIWGWLSYFAFHFIIFGFIFLYFAFKIYYQLRMASIIKWKKKPIFYTVIFDFLYNFSILILPFFSIFIRRKWR